MERIIYSLDLKSINDLCDNTLICNSIFSELSEKGIYTDVEISEKTRTYSVNGYSSDTVVNFADLLMSKMGEIKIEGYYKAIGGKPRIYHAGRTSYAKRFSLYQLPDQKHKVDYGYRYIYTLRHSTNPKAYLRQVDFAVKAENIIPGLYLTKVVSVNSNQDSTAIGCGKIFYVPMEGCDKKVLESTLNFLKNKEGGENDIKLLEAFEKRVNEIIYEN